MTSFLTLTHAQMGPTAGPNSDGVLIGASNPQAAPICLSGFHSLGSQHIALYHTQSDSSVVITDETGVSAWSYGVGTDDVQILFDMSSQIDTGICGIAVNVTAAGSYTGALQPVVKYWNGSEFTSPTAINVTGDLKQAGLLQINFSTIPTTSQSNAPHCLPAGSAGIKPWLFVSFPGLTWTTSATLSSAWTICSVTRQLWRDITATVAQTAATPDFTSNPPLIAPQVGDIVLYGSPNKFCKITERLFRAAASTYTKEWVYWNGSAWAQFDTANMFDGGSLNQAAVPNGQSYLQFVTGFIPPTDWVSTTLTDTAGNLHAGYFVGQRVVAVQQPFMPPAPANFTFTVTELMGANVSGAQLANGCFFNSSVLQADQVCASESVLVVANTRTGQAAGIKVPANTDLVNTPISLTGQNGDSLISVQVAGSAVLANNLKNAMLILEGI